MNNILIDFVSGGICGLINCISGFFLDTIKVRMQMNPQFSMTQTFKYIIKNQGAAQLFSGIYYPIMTIPIINSVVYSSYQYYKVLSGAECLGFWNGFSNGAFAGLMVSTIATPMELVKCLMQFDKAKQYSHSRQCLKHILLTQGFTGLYKGNVSTIIRELPGYGSQFAAYQYLKGIFITPDHQHLTIIESIAVCPIAAAIGWFFSYPQDVIKTKIQIEPRNTYRSRFGDGGFYECGKVVYRTMGVRGFFVGLWPTIIRALYSDSLGIIAYQKCRQFMWHLRTIY